MVECTLFHPKLQNELAEITESFKNLGVAWEKGEMGERGGGIFLSFRAVTPPFFPLHPFADLPRVTTRSRELGERVQQAVLAHARRVLVLGGDGAAAPHGVVKAHLVDAAGEHGARASRGMRESTSVSVAPRRPEPDPTCRREALW